jgi:hypothetical protein
MALRVNVFAIRETGMEFSVEDGNYPVEHHFDEGNSGGNLILCGKVRH